VTSWTFIHSLQITASRTSKHTWHSYLHFLSTKQWQFQSAVPWEQSSRHWSPLQQKTHCADHVTAEVAHIYKKHTLHLKKSHDLNFIQISCQQLCTTNMSQIWFLFIHCSRNDLVRHQEEQPAFRNSSDEVLARLYICCPTNNTQSTERNRNNWYNQRQACTGFMRSWPTR